MAVAGKDQLSAHGSTSWIPVLRTWLAVFAVTFVLYSLTASRGTQWQDSGSHILRIATHQLLNPRGLALTHPLHYWLGRFTVSLNLLEPCLAVTLVSSLAAALAVANTFGCVQLITRRQDAALAACCALAFAHTFWQMATITEVYTLAVCLLAGETWSLLSFIRSRNSKALWLALGLNGLGLADHNLALLTTPVVIVIALLAIGDRSITIRDLAIGAFCWLVGSLPYTALVFLELLRSGDGTTTLHSALFGHNFAKEVLNYSLSNPRLWISTAFVLLNFPNLLLPAAVWGASRKQTPSLPSRARKAILAGLFLHVAFAFRYPVTDQHFFFLPTYFFLVVLGGIGFASWLDGGSRRGRLAFRSAVATLIVTPAIYAATPNLARYFHVLAAYARHKPYRDDYTYVFTPWSVVESSAQIMSRQALELAGPRGLIIVEDKMSEPAVRYQIWRAHETDVRVVCKPTAEVLSDAWRHGRNIVFVPANVEQSQPPSIPAKSWRRAGQLYVLETATRIKRRKTASP